MRQHVSGHEAYLRLKETEYAQGLDIVYIVSGFHIFSSFKLLSAHYRAATHILKLVAIILYAALFYYTAYQVIINRYCAMGMGIICHSHHQSALFSSGYGAGSSYAGVYGGIRHSTSIQSEVYERSSMHQLHLPRIELDDRGFAIIL